MAQRAFTSKPLLDRVNGADPSICARCAALGETCCYGLSGVDDAFMPVTEWEIERVLAEANWLTRDQLVTECLNTPDFLAHLIKLFPGEGEKLSRLFPPGGHHYRLATDQDGRCALLGPKGCLVPRTIRPLFCLIYPFWPMGSTAQVFANPECLAQVEAESAIHLCRLLQANWPWLTRLQTHLRRLWGLDNPIPN